MSRYYRANVRINKPNPGRETAIAEALMDYWEFEDVATAPDGLVSDADNYLTGGTTEDEFARDLARCVWAANQGFCKVAVNMTYLEELPSEDYVFDSQDEYDEWLKTTGDGRSVSS
jgi:hypothetical protein